jgi:hypothetical protein
MSPELLIRDYVDRLPESTHSLARESVSNATPAFKAQQRTIQNLVPATEGEEITPLLHQFRLRQKKMNRFGVLISCNEPDSSDGRELDKVEGDIVAFQREYPDLPLSYFRTVYPEGIPIGAVRLGLGNTAIATEALLSPSLTDIILANCDADTITLSSNSMIGMERLFAEHPDEHIIATPRVRHARSGGKLPNMDRVVGWGDARWSYYPPAVESHGAMRASTYALAGGHDPSVSIGETHRIAEELHGRGYEVPMLEIPAVARVSARKMFKQLEEGKTPDHYQVRSRREAYRGRMPDNDLTRRQANAYLNKAGGFIDITAMAIFGHLKEGLNPSEPTPPEVIDGLKRRLALLQRTYGGSRWKIGKVVRKYRRDFRVKP